MNIKRGSGSGSGGPGWQLMSSRMTEAQPGTVLRIDNLGRASVIGRLTVKSDTVPPRSVSNTFTLDLPSDAEMTIVEDDDLAKEASTFLKGLKPEYRVDNRYVIVRGAIRTPTVEIRLPERDATKLGFRFEVEPHVTAGTDRHVLVSRAFSAKAPVAIDLAEIQVVKANLSGEGPQLGIGPLQKPLVWEEDPTITWTTSFLDPSDAPDPTILIGTEVEMRTGFGPIAGTEALASLGVDPAILEGKQLQFKVMVRGASVLQDAGAPAAMVLSPRLAFTPDAPPSFTFRVMADAPGKVEVRVLLYLDDRPALRHDVALTAVEKRAGDQAVLRRRSGSVSVVDGRHLGTLPPPRVVLEVAPYEDAFAMELTVQGLRTEEPVKPKASAAQLVHDTIDWRKRLVDLSNRYGRPALDSKLTELPDALREFATIGAEIHRALFGTAQTRGKEALRRIAEAIAEVRRTEDGRPLFTIAAERFPLPWGVIYDGPLEDGVAIDPQGFWGQRFLIERVAPAVLGKVPPRALGGSPTGRLISCINEDLDRQQQLGAAARQKQFFTDREIPGLTCATPVTNRQQFQDWLTKDDGEGRLLYFFCHGSAATTIDDKYFLSRDAPDDATWLDLGADATARIDIKWLAETRELPLRGQPLVFLNACSTTQGDREFQSQFLTRFIRDYDARGLIGTDWKVPTQFADEFSRGFLEQFFAGRSVGEAYVTTADAFMSQGNPFPLIYSIYGRSDITVQEDAA